MTLLDDINVCVNKRTEMNECGYSMFNSIHHSIWALSQDNTATLCSTLYSILYQCRHRTIRINTLSISFYSSMLGLCSFPHQLPNTIHIFNISSDNFNSMLLKHMLFIPLHDYGPPNKMIDENQPIN